MDFEEKLKQKYPELYADVYCGISISEGWYKIIEQLSEEIININNKIRCAQIKEKFGGLRYYIDFVGDNISDEDIKRIDDLIWKAEETSVLTCEFCGDVGEQRQLGYWTKTTCDDCLIKLKRQNNK